MNKIVLSITAMEVIGAIVIIRSRDRDTISFVICTRSAYEGYVKIEPNEIVFLETLIIHGMSRS